MIKTAVNEQLKSLKDFIDSEPDPRELTGIFNCLSNMILFHARKSSIPNAVIFY